MPAYQQWNRTFFPQTCKQVCASVRNIGFMFWGQSTLLGQKHNLNLRPSLGAYIQDHRTCYKPWKSTPRPPLVRKQMQLINLSFPVSVCNKPTTSYNMINQKKNDTKFKSVLTPDPVIAVLFPLRFGNTLAFSKDHILSHEDCRKNVTMPLIIPIELE